jgi:hypothetical protein
MAAKRRKSARSRKVASARSARSAVAIGKDIAAEVLAFRDAALRRRRAALREVPAARAARAVRISPQRLRAAGGPGRAGVLVAEGDSWFDYPWNDVLQMLEDDHGYDVESVAHKGDRVEDMAYGGGQLEEFTRLIEKLLRDSKIPSAILLSGGGNDVAGDAFGLLINHARSARPGLNEDIVRGVIEDRVRNAYITIITAVTQLTRARTGQTIPIVIHGYGHAVPDGRGFAGGWGPLPGPWLEPGFREKGFEDLEDTAPIVEDLIDRFNRMMASVAAAPGFGHVRYVDLRATLPNERPGYKTWWANELHPTKRGFAAVAERFARAL